MPETTPRNRRRTLALRLALAAMAVVVFWLSTSSYRQWRHRLGELTAIAQEHGVVERRPEILQNMRRDAGPTRAALRLARAILADELDRRWLFDLEAEKQAEERERGLERLDVANRLGVEALRERPGSWEALLVLGGSEYLRLTRRRDSRLLRERDLWRRPLEEAHRLAPVQPEPLRFLVAADLGHWSVLSDDERAPAIDRLRASFRDPVTFDLLSTAWLRVAASLDEALAVVPDTTWAWSGLMRYFARRDDWERYCDARVRFVESRRELADERLTEGMTRLRWGDARKGVERLVWVGANTPPNVANVALIERLLAHLPPGVAGEASAEWTGGWLDWAQQRCIEGTGCRLSQAGLQRLVSLNRELPPQERAWGLAVAGAIRSAETVQREAQSDPAGSLEAGWVPYVAVMAPLLAEQSQLSDAWTLVNRIPGPAREGVPYWSAYRRVANAVGADDDQSDAAAALAQLRRSRWSRSDWTASGQVSRLEIWPATAAAGLLVELDSFGSGAFEILWNGSTVDVLRASRGRRIELDVSVEPGSLHTLEVRALEGAPTSTGEVRLLLRES